MIEFKTSLRNIQDNKQKYIFLISVLSIIFGLFTVFLNGALSPQVTSLIDTNMYSGTYFVFNFSIIFVAVFVVCITAVLFQHISKFIYDIRFREIGLYRLSGVSNQRLLKIICFEYLIVAVISIAVGTVVMVIATGIINLIITYLLPYPININLAFVLNGYIGVVGFYGLLTILGIVITFFRIIKTELADVFTTEQVANVPQPINRLETITYMLCAVIIVVCLELIITTFSINTIYDIVPLIIFAIFAMVLFVRGAFNCLPLILPEKAFKDKFNGVTYSRLIANLSSNKKLVTITVVFTAIGLGIVTGGNAMFRDAKSNIQTDDYVWKNYASKIDSTLQYGFENNELYAENYDAGSPVKAIVRNEDLGSDMIKLKANQMALVTSKPINYTFKLLNETELNVINTTAVDSKYKNVLIVPTALDRQLTITWLARCEHIEDYFKDIGSAYSLDEYMIIFSKKGQTDGYGTEPLYKESDFNRVMKEQGKPTVDLRPGEVAYASHHPATDSKQEVSYGNQTFKVVDNLSTNKFSYYVVDDSLIAKFANGPIKTNAGKYQLDITQQEIANVDDKRMLPEVEEYVTYNIGDNYSSRYSQMSELYQRKSIVLFIGMIMTIILFTFVLVYNTAQLLIDSYHFKPEYNKLLQLGMTPSETKQMINKQIFITLGFGYGLALIVWLLGYQFLLMFYWIEISGHVLLRDNLIIIGVVTLWYVLIAVLAKRLYYQNLTEA